MGVFIALALDMERCVGIEGCGKCVQVCPVNIFEARGNAPAVVSENEDECILCDLCVKSCAPGAIAIGKLYGA